MRYSAEDDELEESTNRVMMLGALIMFGMILLFPLYLSFEPSSRDAARETQLQSLAAEGENIWGFNCASCHGTGGEGVTAPALNAKEFLQIASDKQIETFISVGVPGSQMGAYSQDFAGPLTNAQIKAVVTFIRSWEEDAPSDPNWRSAGN